MRWLAAALVWLLPAIPACATELVEVAPGLLVRQGVEEDFDGANRGGIANLAAVIGSRAVAVVDSGGSLLDGQGFLAAIRERTPLPVSHVVITHLHPDHVLGNGAFPDARVVGHARLPRGLAERGPTYLDNMHRLLGDVARGTAIVPPDITVAIGETMTLDLGDRRLRLRAWPTAHTDTDLTVLDEASGTLIAGDLLFVERLPVVDGSLLGWIAVMRELAALPAARAVPGHGPASVSWPGALGPQARYLEGLRDSIRHSLAAGRSLAQTVAETPPPSSGWLLVEDNHPRNVTTGYTELEWE
ncbi:MAG TPA: quinoprotein relay system zinc metallohydrolase 2 [Geminicoccaceae bacterium]|nr:quinoprotein relay system zinc metallohydrolase 2 [Geminicoccus sp.]HMU51045.1 quinoprotein relay system zinc metallohydrolase 2 [Geminicoccaceae bacterium]